MEQLVGPAVPVHVLEVALAMGFCTVALGRTISVSFSCGPLRIYTMPCRPIFQKYQPRSIHSRLIVDSSSPALIFDTKADAPASKNAWLAAGSFIAENMITFIVGFTSVISRHASSE